MGMVCYQNRPPWWENRPEYLISQLPCGSEPCFSPRPSSEAGCCLQNTNIILGRATARSRRLHTATKHARSHTHGHTPTLHKYASNRAAWWTTLCIAYASDSQPLGPRPEPVEPGQEIFPRKAKLICLAFFLLCFIFLH